jgi:hypothetical protein
VTPPANKLDAALKRNKKASKKWIDVAKADVTCRCVGCNGMIHAGDSGDEALSIEITYEGDRAMRYRRFHTKCKGKAK